MTMRFLMLAAMMCVAPAVHAQSTPHDFRQDTPPVPGQIVEPPRERLRLAPSPFLPRSDMLGLPHSGPKGLLRESYNERKYAPSPEY